MRAIRTKVARIERARREESDADQRQNYLLHHRLCACLVIHMPGMDRVRPEHTDPETYLDIQETLAWARGDYAEAERLAGRKSDEDVLPRDWNGLTSTARTRLLQVTLDRCAAEATDRSDRVRAAIAVAAA